MKRRLILLILFAFLISCDGEKIYCNKDLEFCSSIRQKMYQESLVLINDFLKSLNYPGGDFGDNSNLEKLERWLECKSCVSRAEINCFWCLYSNPPGGSIIFTLGENSDTLQVNLLGSIPHEAGSIIN